MKMPRSMIASSLICLLIMFAGCEENGPTIGDPSRFFGCYRGASQIIMVSDKNISITGTNQLIPVKRFLFLKDRAAVNTVNNIVVSADYSIVSIGIADSGFFYNFIDQPSLKALIIPDDAGHLRYVRKVACE